MKRHPARPRISPAVGGGLLMSALLAIAAADDVATPALVVDAAAKPGVAFTPRPTRALADLGSIERDASLDRFGGLASRKSNATGFFRTQQIDGRWWIIDPDGGRFICRGMNSVTPVATKAGREALRAAFSTEANWAAKSTAFLRSAGFNSAGAWSDHALLGSITPPLAQARLWSFMSSYGKKRGGTFMKAGHVGYPNDCPFIFDPEFAEFCDVHASQLAPGKDDPWLIGHFSDNEMPWSRKLLDRYLELPAADPGQRAARKWLEDKHGAGASAETVTDTDRRAFLEFAVDRYLSIVAAAIRKHDPNHLFLGVRLHEVAYDLPEVFRAAGRHCDVLSVNYYRAWTPQNDRMTMWARESGRPFLVTECYAKGADSGMANTGGAGWLVKTQKDRGLFYQHFVLGLLESRSCVGWYWHRYADNDPADKKVDPSNRDSNKGIVSARYEPWRPLLEEMTAVNERVYGIIELFDAQKEGRP